MGGGGTRLEGALARPRPGALAAVRRPGEAWALADTSEDRDRPSAPGLPRTRNQELSAGKENEVCCRGTPKPFPQGRGATGLGRAERRRSPLAWTLSAPPREPAPPWPCADSDPGRPQGRAGPASGRAALSCGRLGGGGGCEEIDSCQVKTASPLKSSQESPQVGSCSRHPG